MAKGKIPCLPYCECLSQEKKVKKRMTVVMTTTMVIKTVMMLRTMIMDNDHDGETVTRISLSCSIHRLLTTWPIPNHLSAFSRELLAGKHSSLIIMRRIVMKMISLLIFWDIAYLLSDPTGTDLTLAFFVSFFFYFFRL